VTVNPDIRWKQRFQNFEKAFTLLHEALEKGPSMLSLLEKEGVIQRFEYSFELAWKTVKDFLEADGLLITPVTPRQVLKDAFVAKIIVDGQVWIDMLDHRNLLSHTYDSSVFEEAVDAIAARYLHAMDELQKFFAGKGVE
jgi:nucleotidyltransferase substrate binding protein (TIGR01987 family)